MHNNDSMTIEEVLMILDNIFIFCKYIIPWCSGLEKSTRPLIFTSASGCRASEILDDSQCKLIFYPYMSIIFVMPGKCLF